MIYTLNMHIYTIVRCTMIYTIFYTIHSKYMNILCKVVRSNDWCKKGQWPAEAMPYFVSDKKKK